MEATKESKFHRTTVTQHVAATELWNTSLLENLDFFYYIHMYHLGEQNVLQNVSRWHDESYFI